MKTYNVKLRESSKKKIKCHFQKIQINNKKSLKQITYYHGGINLNNKKKIQFHSQIIEYVLNMK